MGWQWHQLDHRHNHASTSSLTMYTVDRKNRTFFKHRINRIVPEKTTCFPSDIQSWQNQTPSVIQHVNITASTHNILLTVQLMPGFATSNTSVYIQTHWNSLHYHHERIHAAPATQRHSCITLVLNYIGLYHCMNVYNVNKLIDQLHQVR